MGDGSNVTVPVGANIASESVVKNSNAKIGTKYSFSLLDSYGLSRVIDLVVSVSDGTNTATYPTDSQLLSNSPGALAGDVGAVEFAYTSNAGMNGTTSLLRDGDARTILNTDSFAGNDNGGSDGTALAWAQMNPVSLTLGTGDYTIGLTGTVKENSITLTTPVSFSVAQKLHITAQGCTPDMN